MTIRPMRTDDVDRLRGIAKNSFPLTVRSSFHLGPTVLVAEEDGIILGGVVFKRFRLSQDRTAGIVSWVFVDASARGKGVDGRLCDAAFEQLARNGCDEIFANIDRDNTASGNLFASRGFSPIGPGELLSTYGMRAPAIAWHAAHLFDPGYTMWRRPAAKLPPRPGLQLAVTLVLHVPLVLVVLLRLVSGHDAVVAMLYRLSAVVMVFILVRIGAMKIASRLARIPTTYRMWESGFLLSAIAAAVLGFLMPTAGSLYPTERFRSYSKNAKKLAIISLAGLASVAVLTVAGTVSSVYVTDPVAIAWLWWVRRAGTWFLLTDGLLPIYPFTAYDATRIYRYSVPLWVISAGIALSVAIPALAW